MKKSRFFYYIISSIGIVVVLLAVIIGGVVMYTATGAHAAPSVNYAAQAGILPMRPMDNMSQKMEADEMGKVNPATLIPCLRAKVAPLCYSPQQLRQAYGVDKLIKEGFTGKGRNIVIIDDFQSPTLKQDVALFSKLFGLPQAKINIVTPDGLAPFNPKNQNAVGFATEITLDVEWAHAMAPDATINLVLGNPKGNTIQDQLNALQRALQFAIREDFGSVISMSFGTGETCVSPQFIQATHKLFQQAREKKITMIASSGDHGALVPICDAKGQIVNIGAGVNYPASDPLVTAVGGTTLQLNNGEYQSEMGWTEQRVGQGASGGGFSRVFAKPAYQNKIPQVQKMRGLPDVSFDADPTTGVPIITSSTQPGKTIALPIGGTSLGAPVWAALTAIGTQITGKRLGFMNAALSRIALSDDYAEGFHDILKGNNTYVIADNAGKLIVTQGFAAGRGWDADTGFGTPKANRLIPMLVKQLRANDGEGL